VRHKWHNREIRNCGVDGATGAERGKATDWDADLLVHLPLRGIPGRFPWVNPASWQRDLPGVVPKVRPPTYEGDHPPAPMLVENEYDSSRPGALSERAPALDGCELVFEPPEEISQVAPL
jgi:hypothetical protein